MGNLFGTAETRRNVNQSAGGMWLFLLCRCAKIDKIEFGLLVHFGVCRIPSLHKYRSFYPSTACRYFCHLWLSVSESADSPAATVERISTGSNFTLGRPQIRTTPELTHVGGKQKAFSFVHPKSCGEQAGIGTMPFFRGGDCRNRSQGSRAAASAVASQ